MVGWKLRKKISFKLFLAGGLIWAAAFLPKIALDYTFTPVLNEWLSTYSLTGMLIIIGAYFGIRTVIIL